MHKEPTVVIQLKRFGKINSRDRHTHVTSHQHVTKQHGPGTLLVPPLSKPSSIRPIARHPPTSKPSQPHKPSELARFDRSRLVKHSCPARKNKALHGPGRGLITFSSNLQAAGCSSESGVCVWWKTQTQAQTQTQANASSGDHRVHH